MEIVCQNCGAVVAVNNLGRKKGNYNVQNVLDAYQAHHSVYAAAIIAGVSRPTAWRILRKAGIDTRRKKKEEEK